MGYYAIGIGGTGAKCLESIVHLAAAGMMPDGDLYIFFVDPDASNGSRARAQQTLSYYRQCKDNLTLGQINLLKTRIRPIDSIESTHWTPFTNVRPSLSNFFDYANLDGAINKNHAAAAHLFEVLYSPTERESSLDKGFHGRPSIGSAVMAQTIDFKEVDPWSTFRAQIANDKTAKVFLAGSIFGGTGASGFPTIAQLVKDTLQVELGGALVLPYFKFTSDEDADGLKAKSEYFLMNTQAALKYYHLWKETGIYDAVYLFGNESQTEVENSSGGETQRNAPHFIELYAALAAVHFFETDFTAFANTPYFMTARETRNLLQWKDLPDGNNGDTIRARIGQLARFAFAYLHIYQPELQKIRDNSGRGHNNAPWFANFFRFKKSGLMNIIKRDSSKIQFDDPQTLNLIDHIGTYCETFLRWLTNIQTNHGENEKIGLIQYGAFANESPIGEDNLKQFSEFESNGFSDLIQSQKYSDLNTLWQRMSDANGHNSNAQGLGKFVNALYENCAG